MLVLTRKLNEQIFIGDNITISIVDIKNNRVRIGIEAPSGVDILRSELRDGKKAQPPKKRQDPRVLIVDDSPDDRLLLRRFIADSKPPLDCSETDLGERGLELCRDQPPDCVLLDYQLPDLNGLDFLSQLRREEKSRTIPVILITGQGNEKVAVEAIQNGAQGYLVKQDISPEMLQRAIYQAIRVPLIN